MRVLHVIPGVARRYGGPSQAVTEMCRALQSHGLEVLVATTDADGISRLPVQLGRPIEYEGVPTIFFRRQWSEAYKYSHRLARWLQANVNKFEVIHIHAVFSHACLAAARASLKHNVRYIVRPLGTLDPWSLRQKRFRKRLLWHVGVKQMLCGAAAIHYTTAEERRQAETALGLRRGVVIPLGIDENILYQKSRGVFRQRHSTLGDYPYLLVLCRLHRVKGLELFLRVFLDVTRRKEFRHWRLVVAGEGGPEYVASLKRLAEEQDSEGRVLFMGWIDGAEKASALQEAALLALPSHHENFGICIAEALACGVPVLVSPNVNLAKEIETAGAGWIAPLERENFSTVLAEVLSDAGEREIRGKAGREFVNRCFSWPTVAAELISFYRSVSNGRHSY